MDRAVLIRKELRLGLLSGELAALASCLVGMVEGISCHLVHEAAVAGLTLARS